MTKYYTMAIANITSDQEKQLAEHWRGYGWWHYVSNFWLFRDVSGATTAASLRDEVLKIAPAARVMIVEGQPTTWAASSMNEPNREWLRKFWPPEGV